MPKISGFTMVELLISIGIFLLITSMVIVNFRAGEYKDQLNGAAQQIQSAVRETQSATISGNTVLCPSATLATARPQGVHIKLSSTQPEIKEFADCGPQPTPNNQYDGTGTDVLLKDITLPTKVKIDCIQLPGDGQTCMWGEGNSLDVVFSPLTESVFINGSANNAAGFLTIKLRHDNIVSETTKFLNVQINPLTGQVFVQ